MAVTQPSHAPVGAVSDPFKAMGNQGKDVEVVWPENGGAAVIGGMNQ